jgi:hypothetical protein
MGLIPIQTNDNRPNILHGFNPHTDPQATDNKLNTLHGVNPQADPRPLTTNLSPRHGFNPHTDPRPLTTNLTPWHGFNPHIHIPTQDLEFHRPVYYYCVDFISYKRLFSVVLLHFQILLFKSASNLSCFKPLSNSLLTCDGSSNVFKPF